jgi:cellulose synthase/poly-beta-1,6-N-acetylglucosamine synthase-like glycosyltransferase
MSVAAVLYVVGSLFLVIFVSGFGVLLAIYLFTRNANPQTPAISDDEALSVTVQLPIYNEPHVVDRLLEACVKLDYPAEKLRIQVLDDSTDYTTDRIACKIRELQNVDLCNISHIHRATREGYKAGALDNAMRFVETDCVAIFDADFVPEPDFLRRTMPHFNRDPRLGLIQTRWDHLNLDYNLLTRAQALSIDAHFAIEQVARNRGQLPMSMNGTGGIWRVSAIENAGGWSSSTLTEDLDLSYRAYMRGWRFLYLVDVAVPGELPPLVQAYKRQQARWATGSTQCLIKHTRALLASPGCSPLGKIMGTLHLAQYAIQPIILMLFLLTPLLLWGHAFNKLPNMTLLALVGPIPPLVIALGQMELYNDWLKRLLFFPAHFMTGVAIVLNNSLAVIDACFRRNMEHEFERTPKFRLTKRDRHNRIITEDVHIDAVTIGELLLACYAIAGLYSAMQTLPALVPYMLSYSVSFIAFAGWNIFQLHGFVRRRALTNQ